MRGASALPSGSHPSGQAQGLGASRFDPSRGATSFLVSACKKQRTELHAILADDAKLKAASEYHNIKPEWARFWIGEELNRNERKD